MFMRTDLGPPARGGEEAEARVKEAAVAAGRLLACDDQPNNASEGG